MKFLGRLSKDLFVDPLSASRHGAQQASRCCIVDATWVATGKLMNQILHAVIEELHVATATTNRIVDVLASLVFRKWLQLIATASFELSDP